MYPGGLRINQTWEEMKIYIHKKRLWRWVKFSVGLRHPRAPVSWSRLRAVTKFEETTSLQMTTNLIESLPSEQHMDIPFRPPTPFLEKKMALAHQYESLTSEELLEWACYFCCLATPPFFLASRTCAVAGSSYKRKRKTKSLCIVLPSTPSLGHACRQLGRIPATGATYNIEKPLSSRSARWGLTLVVASSI